MLTKCCCLHAFGESSCSIKKKRRESVFYFRISGNKRGSSRYTYFVVKTKQKPAKKDKRFSKCIPQTEVLNSNRSCFECPCHVFFFFCIKILFWHVVCGSYYKWRVMECSLCSPLTKKLLKTRFIHI